MLADLEAIAGIPASGRSAKCENGFNRGSLSRSQPFQVVSKRSRSTEVNNAHVSAPLVPTHVPTLATNPLPVTGRGPPLHMSTTIHFR